MRKGQKSNRNSRETDTKSIPLTNIIDMTSQSPPDVVQPLQYEKVCYDCS